MATRGNIGMRNEDGTITGIYVHWDSYPRHNGTILLECYNKATIVKELLKLGDLSSLNKKLDFDTTKPHTFDNPQEDVCVAYCRDRGETDTASRMFKNIKEYERNMDNWCVEFQYLFETDESWSFREGYNGVWKKLSSEDCV